MMAKRLRIFFAPDHRHLNLIHSHMHRNGE
jgi:hypothetical protein